MMTKIAAPQAVAASSAPPHLHDSPPTADGRPRWPHSFHRHAACPLHPHSHSTRCHRQHCHTHQPDHQPQSRCRRSLHHHTPRITRCSPRCRHRHPLPHRRGRVFALRPPPTVPTTLSPTLLYALMPCSLPSVAPTPAPLPACAAGGGGGWSGGLLGTSTSMAIPRGVVRAEARPSFRC